MKAQSLQAPSIAAPPVGARSAGRVHNDAPAREHPLQVIDARVNAENRRAAIRSAILRWRAFGSTVVLCLFALLLMPLPAHADKVRDLVQVAGVRSNQLIGYGLVVGLDGSGDQTTQAPFTTQSLENMLQQFGITVPANARPQLKNAAAVMVTADLPAFAKPGQAIDVTVASIGNAKSIRGGQLLMTPLRGADGNVYAVAQGSVVVGGVSAQGKSGSSVQVNISASGRVVFQRRQLDAQPQHRRFHHGGAHCQCHQYGLRRGHRASRGWRLGVRARPAGPIAKSGVAGFDPEHRCAAR